MNAEEDGVTAGLLLLKEPGRARSPRYAYV